MSRRFILFLVLILTMLLPLTAAARSSSPSDQQTIGFVPRAAQNISDQLDEQIMRILTPSGYGRGSVAIAFTVPVSVDNLKHTSSLARQMAEEITQCLVIKGYSVDEIRKGNEIVMTPERGEFLLTRDTNKLMDRNVNTEMVMTGTYTLTDRSMRFNIRMLHTPTREVLAMGSATVPITDELVPLTSDRSNQPPLGPTVRTRLQR